MNANIVRHLTIHVLAALSLLLLTGFGAQAHAATVATHKADYWPGRTVIIRGSAWQPGGIVTLLL